MDFVATLETGSVVSGARTASAALRDMKSAVQESAAAFQKSQGIISASAKRMSADLKQAAKYQKSLGGGGGGSIFSSFAGMAGSLFGGSKKSGAKGASTGKGAGAGGGGCACCSGSEPPKPDPKDGKKGNPAGGGGGKCPVCGAGGGDKGKGEDESRRLNEKEEKKREDARKKEEKAEKSRADALKNAKKSSMETANFMKAGLTAGLALGAAKIGIGGLGDLTKMAVGLKGMAKLDAITARTTLNFKRMFLGIDSSPLIRAADVFSKNFGPTTIMGRAIGDIFTRSFNGIFAAVEKLQPYLTAFGQGMVIAFLMAEVGIARAKAALQPYTGALDGIISSTTGMRVATVLGGAALVTLAGYAVVAAAPFLALSAAILAVSAAFEQASKLAKEWDGDAFWNKVKSDLGINNQADTEKAMGITVGSDKDQKDNKGKGQTNGMAMGLGMVAGMDASGAAVEAAGKRMAANADRGVKTGADIHSPSRVFRKSGRFMGEGVALGMEDTEGRVQRAADDSLVPTPPGGLKAGSGGISGAAKGGLQIMGPLIQIQQLVVNGGEDLRLQIHAILESETQKAMDALALKFPLAA